MNEQDKQLTNQIVSSLVNNLMNLCEPNPILKMCFEKEFVKEDFELDWDKRLDENLQWKNKGDVK